jgi:Tol biopolymer transport system component
MPLPAGTRLGPYEIIGVIGAGGMGEVYRARDTRLGRDVAVKVLPESFASDPDRRTRFEREAQAVAALSHPNVLAIFDTGIHEGQLFVVTELLVGGTLRERLAAGALPVRKATDIAVQIARGLSAAHAKGLVHRDLKPENVFIVEDGQVKILDFGLARLTPSTSGATETMAAVTDPGSVMGTVGYMAPEQVRGQAVDARADLFAFGAVLYEMVAGVRAFQRDTAADSISAILTQDPPDLPAKRPDVPAVFDRIVRHCLEKNPNERFQTARDVAFALEALSGSATSATPVVASVTRSWWRIAAAAALLSMATAVAYVAGWATAGGRAADIRFLTKTFDPIFITNARFLPDGQTIIYSAARQGTSPELFMVRPDSVVPQQVAEAGTHLLSVSSKGELAVLTGARFLHHRLFSGTLARLSLGGAARPWLEHVREADWSPDGSTLAIVREVDATTDRLEYPIGTVLHETRGYLSDVRVSPDGRRVAFFEHDYRGDDRGFVKVVDQSKRVIQLAGEYWGEEGLAWSADGTRLIFGAADAATASGMEPYEVKVREGATARVVLHVMGGLIPFDAWRDGRWLVSNLDYRFGMFVKLPAESGERDLSWLDKSNTPILSEDGRVVVFSDENWSAGRDYAVALRRTDGSPAVRLGPGGASGLSPDGKWVVAVVYTKHQLVFYSTGPGEPKTLDVSADQFGHLAWFPDSRHILLCGVAAPGRCFRQSMDGGPMTPVTPNEFNDGSVAPDGRILAVNASGTGRLFAADGATWVPVKGLDVRDSLVGWGADRRSIFVQAGTDIPARLERIDLMTGTRSFLKEIVPPDRAGLIRVRIGNVIDDGRGYVYDVARFVSTLVVISGAK